MASWRAKFDPQHLYFVTTGTDQRQHLFESPLFRRLIVDTFDCMRLRGWFRLYGYVVMPNHIHLLIQCPATHTLAATMRDLKKHIADRYIRRLEATRDHEALQTLMTGATPSGKPRHTIWEKDYLPKTVATTGFLLQKLKYIHANPCQEHWSLASTPEGYPWSSARYYIRHERGIIPIDNVMKVIEDGVKE